MGYKIKKIYVGDKQVRPSEIIETYTEARFGNNTSGITKTQNIYKSGYKVVKIEFDTTISAGSSTAYGTISIRFQNTNAYGAYICYGGSIGNYAYLLDGPSDTYQSPTSPEFGYTTAHVEITPDYIKLSNGTGTVNKTLNYSASSKSQIETLFAQSDLKIYLRAIYPYLGPTTIKVTYKPN